MGLLLVKKKSIIKRHCEPQSGAAIPSDKTSKRLPRRFAARNDGFFTSLNL
jgi:hypothetical protein